MLNLPFICRLNVVLLVNWVAGPVFAIAIWSKVSFSRMLVYIVVWLLTDKVWDSISTVLIKGGASLIGATPETARAFDVEGRVPTGMAAMMLLDVLITLVLPWGLGAYFLGWVE